MAVGTGNHRGGRNHRSAGASHTRDPPVLNRHRRRPGVQSQDAAEAGIAAGHGGGNAARAAGHVAGVLSGSQGQHHHQHQCRQASVAGGGQQRFAKKRTPVLREIVVQLQIFPAKDDRQHGEIAEQEL